MAAASRSSRGIDLQRGIEAERHVPHLAGEDQHDRTQLHAQLPGGEQRHHGQHHAGQEAQHRDGLQNIQHGDHHRLHALVVSGDVAVGDGEDQAQHVRHAPCAPASRRRKRAAPRASAKSGRPASPRPPVAHHGEHGVDAGEDRREHQQVHQRRTSCARGSATGPKLRERHQRTPTSASAGCGVSSGMKNAGRRHRGRTARRSGPS